MDAEARFEELAATLEELRGVERVKMMGFPSLKHGGKLLASFYRDEDAMVFKLPDAGAREAALALDGAHLFDPMGGRPMKEWVVVPSEHADRWADLADQALG
jgi:hypothetical protein